MSQRSRRPEVAGVLRDAEPAVAALQQIDGAKVQQVVVSGTAVAAGSTSGVVGGRSAVADCEWSASVNSRSTREVGVGEHVTGEPFLWRGIFDMP